VSFQDDIYTLDIWFVRLNFNQTDFRYLVLFLRHYSLKQTVVRAEDVEEGNASIPSEPGHGTS
jgi:hypothetical protein